MPGIVLGSGEITNKACAFLALALGLGQGDRQQINESVHGNDGRDRERQEGRWAARVGVAVDLVCIFT